MPIPPVYTDTVPMLGTPLPLEPARYVRNGMVPNANFESDAAAHLNAAAACRRKQIFGWGCGLDDIPSPSSVTRTRWRFAGHTGVLLRRLHALVTMARSHVVIGGGTGTNPTCTVYITNADGSTVYGQASASFGSSPTATNDTPNEFGVFDLEIACPADTDIFGRVEDSDGGRCIAITVYEEAKKISAANGYIVPQSVAVTGPIYDGRRQDMYELATELHKKNAAPLWPFTVDDQSSPLVTASSTWTNIIDSSTSVSASSAGATLDLRYCKTRSTSSVPCVLAIYGSMESSGVGISGDVRIVDSSGTVVDTVSVTSTTAGWVTAAIDMPARLDKFDLQYRSADNLNSFNLGAASLFQYAA